MPAVERRKASVNTNAERRALSQLQPGQSVPRVRGRLDRASSVWPATPPRADGCRLPRLGPPIEARAGVRAAAPISKSCVPFFERPDTGEMAKFSEK